jgi:hypothetical protein
MRHFGTNPTGANAYLNAALEHDPERHALGLDPGVDFRFFEKIMLQQRARPDPI